MRDAPAVLRARVRVGRRVRGSQILGDPRTGEQCLHCIIQYRYPSYCTRIQLTY
jgi:hypothetical protein